jgi:hypothetical protein
MVMDAYEADNALDPLFADRFVEAVAKSLQKIAPSDRRDWLETFVLGIKSKIERSVLDEETKRWLARQRDSEAA